MRQSGSVRPRAEARPLAVAGLLFLWLLAGAAPPASSAEGDDDPWRLLVGVRESLVAGGPVVADFVQTYIPAGFASGERESGKVSLALPSCLRWDYELPFAKHYLLCGRLVYAWNPGDGSGRRQVVDAAREPGLDLLFLSVDELRGRYTASARRLDSGEVEVALSPLSGGEGPRTATLLVDASGAHLDGLSYTDGDGSVTRFTLSGWRALRDDAPFSPPQLEWIED